MADELPDDIEQSIPAFKPHADVINAILAALRPLAKIEGQGGIDITLSDEKIVVSGLSLQSAISQITSDPTLLAKTFFSTTSVSTPADVDVSAGAINSVVYAGGTISAPADGDKVYIEATISGETVTAVTVSNAASVPADSSTHVYTLLATVAVSGGVATPTPVAWNYSQMQICGGVALWGGFGA